MKTSKPTRRYAGLLLLAGPLLLHGPAFGQAPQIVRLPLTHTISTGATVDFEVEAAGALPLTYIWYRNLPGTPGPGTPGYTNMTLSQNTCGLTLTNPAATFWRLMITNAEGKVTSPYFYVAVITPGMETNGFALSLLTTTNTSWRIECTTNLLSDADWFTLTNITVTLAPRAIRFLDTAATNRNRLYRVVPTMVQ